MLLAFDGYLRLDPTIKELGPSSEIRFTRRTMTNALSVTALPYTSLQSSGRPRTNLLDENLDLVRRSSYARSTLVLREARRARVFVDSTWKFTRVYKFDGARQVGLPVRVWNGSSWE